MRLITIIAAGILGANVVAHAQVLRVDADAGAASLLALAQRDFERASGQQGRFSILTASSGLALAKLCRGEIVLAGAARAMSEAERVECAQQGVTVVELPIATDTLVVVVNPTNTWAKQVSLAQLRRAWREAPDKARHWSDLDPAWPRTPLKLYGPGPALGLADRGRSALGSDRMRRDMATSEVLGVTAAGVARDRDALGILDRSTYLGEAKRLRAVPVDAAGAAPDALIVSLYVYVSTRALEDSRTRAILDHLLVQAARLTGEANLIAHPAQVYEQGRQRLIGKP